jgi:hypothetical protein
LLGDFIDLFGELAYLFGELANLFGDLLADLFGDFFLFLRFPVFILLKRLLSLTNSIILLIRSNKDSSFLALASKPLQ